MAGYFIYSVDADVFLQLTTAPTVEQSLVLADSVIEDLEDALDEYGDEDAADPAKWSLERRPLAKSIRKRLASADWYVDLTMGDAVIWDSVLRSLMDEPGEEIGIGFQCENDGFLSWEAARFAAEHGAPMMAEPTFGNSGFRYSGKSQGDLELMYTIYLLQQTQQLLQQVEIARTHFEQLPEEVDGARAQFFEGLVKPVSRIALAGRVMWVQTDT